MMRNLVGLLGAWATFATLSQAIAYSDNFDDGVLNPGLWSEFKQGLPSVSETNGRLEVVLPANSTGDIFRGWVLGVPKLVGDFVMTIDFDHPLWPSNNGVRTGMCVQFGSQFYTIERTCLSASLGEEVILSDIGGVLTTVPFSANTGKLKLARISNVVTGFYWDGAVWRSMPSWNAPEGDMDFYLGSWSHDLFFGHQDALTTFDNFLVVDSAVPDPDSVVVVGVLLAMLASRRFGKSIRN